MRSLKDRGAQVFFKGGKVHVWTDTGKAVEKTVMMLEKEDLTEAGRLPGVKMGHVGKR